MNAVKDVGWAIDYASDRLKNDQEIKKIADANQDYFPF